MDGCNPLGSIPLTIELSIISLFDLPCWVTRRPWQLMFPSPMQL